ncbi:MAG: hypothetical protein IPN29_06015 [Saprospiraceae bacterium]|nr:hypothetical protein [Saprospiraceae bacterium]
MLVDGDKNEGEGDDHGGIPVDHAVFEILKPAHCDKACHPDRADQAGCYTIS